MFYLIKAKNIFNRTICGLIERLLPRRGQSKWEVARPTAFLHVTATCLLCMAFTGNTAFAQDNAAPGTRIEADEQTGTIRVVIDGEERAVFDGDGLHVDGNITYTGTLTDISDHRLKTDIHRLPPQAENIAALNPVAFSMTDDPAQRTEYGVIAQEVEAMYSAPLISAVQELQADNARLQERVEALQAATEQLASEGETR